MNPFFDFTSEIVEQLPVARNSNCFIAKGFDGTQPKELSKEKALLSVILECSRAFGSDKFNIFCFQNGIPNPEFLSPIPAQSCPITFALSKVGDILTSLDRANGSSTMILHSGLSTYSKSESMQSLDRLLGMYTGDFRLTNVQRLQESLSESDEQDYAFDSLTVEEKPGKFNRLDLKEPTSKMASKALTQFTADILSGNNQSTLQLPFGWSLGCLALKHDEDQAELPCVISAIKVGIPKGAADNLDFYNHLVDFSLSWYEEKSRQASQGPLQFVPYSPYFNLSTFLAKRALKSQYESPNLEINLNHFLQGWNPACSIFEMLKSDLPFLGVYLENYNDIVIIGKWQPGRTT